MTSRTFSVKNRPVSNFFKFTLKKQAPLTTLVVAFSLLLIPGMLVRDLISYYEWGTGKYDFAADEFYAWAMVALIASAVLMFMLLLSNFGFLFSKKAGDVFQALPLTRNQTLFARSIPALIGGAVNFVICFAAIAFVNFMPNVKGIPISEVVKAFAVGLLYLTVLSAFSLLFVVVSGGFFDSLVAFAAVNLCPVFIALMLFFVVENNTTGLDVKYDYIIYTTPVAFMFYKYVSMGQMFEFSKSVTPIEKTTVWSILGVAVFGVLCVIAAIKLYKVRKSETAGESYSFKFVPAIITILASMVGGFFISEVLNGFDVHFDVLFWFFFIVGALLCSVAVGAVITRGFKTTKSSFLKGLVAVVIMIALVIVTMFAGTAAQNHIPEADDIKEIRVGYREDVIYIDNFDVMLNLHSGIVENIKNSQEGGVPSLFANNLQDVRITYILKDSTRITRNYFGSLPTMRTLRAETLAVIKSEEFLKQFDNCFVPPVNDRVEIRFMGDKYGYDSTVSVDGMAGLTEEEARAFFELFKEELASADLSVFDENCYGVYFSGVDHKDFFIPKSFTKTIDYLLSLTVPEEEYYKSLKK